MTPAEFQRARRRGGFSSKGLIVALVVLVAVPTIAYSVWPRLPWSSVENGPMMHVVERGEFVHEITDRGNVESASNVEIRCEVRSPGTSGTTILEIVPEGTYVQPGDLLVRLDSSSLEDDRTKQQVAVNNAKALMIEAQHKHETAVIAKKEYEQGTYIQQLQELEAARSLAEENLRRANDYYQFSKRLAERGYVTKLQLEADNYSVQKARIDLETADTKLRVLKEFTKKKMLIQLDSDIGTSEAKLHSAKASYEVEVSKLKLIESQIEKCTIRSPEAGQVVYANVQGYRGGNEVIIEAGASVRENQEIIRLPDPKRMQVKAKIAEGKVAMVGVGMPARIRLDAFPNVELTGKVEKVNDYPEPTPWYGTSVKEYMTTISIDEPPPGLRPGLTAEATILIERRENCVRVPVQTVLEHGEQHYCVVGAPGRWQARPVTIGPTNDKFVVIEQGLEPGESIVLNAAALREQLDLPKLLPQRNGPRPRRQRGEDEMAGPSPAAAWPGGAGGDQPSGAAPAIDAQGPGAAGRADGNGHAAPRERDRRGEGGGPGGRPIGGSNPAPRPPGSPR